VRLYLEVVEILPEGAEAGALDFIRIDVTGRDWRAELEAVKELLDPKNKYVIQLHFCGHDECKPCAVEVVEE